MWGELVGALRARDWAAARAAKRAVEEAERTQKAARTKSGGTWQPSFFEAVPLPPPLPAAPAKANEKADEAVLWRPREGALDRAFDAERDAP